jgi:hypothetical protein
MKDITAQGRWSSISHDLLANFCQVLALSQELMNAIIGDGVLVPGARNGERNKVRHPLLTPWSQTQATLIRLGKAIPLVDPKGTNDGNVIDAYIDGLIGE